MEEVRTLGSPGESQGASKRKRSKARKGNGKGGGNGKGTSRAESDWTFLGYKWAQNFQRKADAAKVGKELESIRQEKGHVTAADIVEKALDPKTELHTMLEWDDSIAAQRYREEQARSIHRTLRLVYEKDDGEEIEMRLVVHVPKEYTGGETGGYILIDEVQQYDAAEKVMLDAERGLHDWCGRYMELAQRVPAAFASVQEALKIIRRSREEM